MPTVIAAAPRPAGASPPSSPLWSVDPAAGTVYVANSGSGTVSVIDEATSAVTATIPVGSGPDGVGGGPRRRDRLRGQQPRWHRVGDRPSGDHHHQPPAPGTAGTPYTTTLHVAGGIAPWTWAITGGSLPAGPGHRMTKRL